MAAPIWGGHHLAGEFTQLWNSGVTVNANLMWELSFVDPVEDAFLLLSIATTFTTLCPFTAEGQPLANTRRAPWLLVDCDYTFEADVNDYVIARPVTDFPNRITSNRQGIALDIWDAYVAPTSYEFELLAGLLEGVDLTDDRELRRVETEWTSSARRDVYRRKHALALQDRHNKWVDVISPLERIDPCSRSQLARLRPLLSA